MNWEEGENRLLVQKSMTNLDTSMGVPDQSGKKGNLSGSSSPNCEVFALSKVDCHFPLIPISAVKVHVLCPPSNHFDIIRREQCQCFGDISEVIRVKEEQESAEPCALEWPPCVLSTVRRHHPVRRTSLSPNEICYWRSKSPWQGKCHQLCDLHPSCASPLTRRPANWRGRTDRVWNHADEARLPTFHK